MKGIIIYEDYRGKKVVEAVKLGVVNYITSSSDGDWVSELSGIRKSSTQAYCNKEDTYDFEVGALIALMKMCGFDKSYKAIEEAFKYNSYDTKKTKELEEEINNLKKRINELEIYNNQLEDRVAAEQRGGYKLLKDMEKLQHEYDLCKNSENALKCSVDYLNKTIAKLNTAIDGYKEDLNKATKRCEELEIKESILNKQEETIKKREEKLFVYFGGRQNGKQHTALVNMFKKLDQKKVDAAYKEAYNTTLPVWQKEVLNQMYGVYKESKEKNELPRTLDINGVKYRKMLQIKDFGEQINKLTVDSLIEQSRAFTRKCVDEWLYKIPTKREEMWENILGASKCPPVDIKVAKQDITSFLRELQDKIPEARWNGSDCPPVELSVPDWFKHDYIYFALFRNDDKGGLRICYDNKPHSWINKPVIEYIAPMRWDLFKKGRLVVKVNYDNYKEFYEACEKEIGRKPRDIYTGTFTVYYKYEKELKKYIFHTRPYIDTIPFAKKIVNWEDVR